MAREDIPSGAAAGRSPAGVRVRPGVPYGHGKLLDIYQPETAGSAGPAGPPGLPGRLPVVLLWHGVGADERDVLAPLASAVAAQGVLVFVPDWSAAAPDRGRSQLFASLAFTREQAARYGGDPGRIALAGWSLGGRSAAGVAVCPAAASGWRPAAVVCLGSGFSLKAAPLTSAPPLDLLRQGGATPVPCWLVHGTADPVVPVRESRAFAAALAAAGWPVRLAEPATDHAGVVMASYDPDTGRCVPATAGHAVEAGRLTARFLAEAAASR